LNLIVKAFEHANDFVELDFVQGISSRVYPGVEANVVRVAEDVYINRINPTMHVNEMVKAESSSHAIELVKEYVNYDISSTITDLLEGEAKEQALVEAKKNDLFDRINFLKDAREKLSRQDQTNEAIKKADSLLVSEIETFQTELNTLATA